MNILDNNFYRSPIWLLRAYSLSHAEEEMNHVLRDDNLTGRQKTFAVSVNMLHIVAQLGEAVCHFVPTKVTSLTRVNRDCLVAGSCILAALTAAMSVFERVVVRGRGDGLDIALTVFCRMAAAQDAGFPIAESIFDFDESKPASLTKASAESVKVSHSVVGSVVTDITTVSKSMVERGVRDGLYKLPSLGRRVGAVTFNCIASWSRLFSTST